MKKHWFFALLLVLGYISSVCAGNENDVTGTLAGNQAKGEAVVKIRLVFGDSVLTAPLDDNETSRDFMSQLPLTLVFKDYAGKEKVSYPPKKLATRNAPPGWDPSVGEITYYSPWGNLAIFYKDFGYAPGLVCLGRIDSSVEKLGRMRGEFKVIIERMIGNY